MTATITSAPTNLPATPTLGMEFQPDKTDAIGVITNITTERDSHGKRILMVTYHFGHAPSDSHTRPYSEVRKMGNKVIS